MSNILVVEDDPLTLHSVIDLLEAENFQVTGAADGEIALEIVAKKKFDLIICDLLLPKINGYEFLSSIRKNVDTANIPFIVLTGQNKRKDILLGREIGVSDYITKPFVNQELINSIQEQLAKKNFLEKCYQVEIQGDREIKPEKTQRLHPQKHPLYDDAVTNLPNQLNLRDQFENIVSNYVEERIKSSSSDKSKSTSIAICCINLNYVENFRNQETINSILKIATQRLNNCIGNKSTIMRLYDEDFAIIFPYINHFNQAIELVKTAQAALSEPYAIVYPNMGANQVINLTPYIGISFYPDHGKDIELLIERAKKALENAKQNSEDCYEVYQPNSTYAQKYRSLALLDDLHCALENNELDIYYQPQVDLLAKKVVGCEALIRWNHPQRGNISPQTFIPIAKDIDLIESIETWFLSTVCQQIKIWQESGFGQLKLAINLSDHQFYRHNLTLKIAEALTQIQLPPESLTVELTESILLKDCKSSLEKLCDLKSLGIDITLDNYGSGYCSLNYLQQFPFNSLKVDLVYLDSYLGEKTSQLALKHIIRIAQRLKIKVIVEKVETQEQLNFLRQHQVELAQGYFLSLPLTTKEFDTLLNGQSNWLDWLSSIFNSFSK